MPDEPALHPSDLVVRYITFSDFPIRDLRAVAVAGDDVHGVCSLPHLKLKRFRVIGLAGVCIERDDVGNQS